MNRIGNAVSAQSLWYMRQFYLEYKEMLNLQWFVGEILWRQALCKELAGGEV